MRICLNRSGYRHFLTRRVIACLFLYQLTAPLNASQPPADNEASFIGIQYLSPIEDDRDIKTTNVDVHFLLTRHEKTHLILYWGWLASYARGNITQLEGSLEAGNLREVRYENSALGIGPGVLVRFEFWRNRRILLSLDVSGNLLAYNKRFPAGGDYYNFMWRGGPAVSIAIAKTKRVGVGYQWAHISNGQSAGPRNPSYEASGFMVRFSGLF